MKLPGETQTCIPGCLQVADYFVAGSPVCEIMQNRSASKIHADITGLQTGTENCDLDSVALDRPD